MITLLLALATLVLLLYVPLTIVYLILGSAEVIRKMGRK